MKTKLLFLSVATLATVGIVAVTNTTASAAPETTDVTTTLKAPTTGTVTPPIVNPTVPGGTTDQEGPLSLDYVSPLNFGETEITTTTQTLTAITAVNEHFGLQVTDTRGTGEGWKVDVGLSDFTGKNKVTNKIKGAELTLPVGTLTTGNAAGITEAAPVSSTVSLIPAGATGTIFAATTDKGMGTWFSEFDKAVTTLKIPAGNLADEYTATLTWTLTSAI